MALRRPSSRHHERRRAFYLPGPGSAGIRRSRTDSIKLFQPHQINRCPSFRGGRYETPARPLDGQIHVELGLDGLNQHADVSPAICVAGANGFHSLVITWHWRNQRRTDRPLIFFNGTGPGLLVVITESSCAPGTTSFSFAMAGMQPIYLNGSAVPEISGEIESSVPEAGSELFNRWSL